MITRFRQSMVTIKVSDHHLDDEELRTRRLFYATKLFGEELIKGIDNGDLKNIFPNISACMINCESRGTFAIQVVVYGVPEDKRKLLISFYNCWHLNNHYPHNLYPWFNDEEIALNVNFLDGECSELYSKRTFRFKS